MHENSAPGCCTYYYTVFTVDSKSDFRSVKIHSVSELQLGMQDMVVYANQITPFRSRAHGASACVRGNTGYFACCQWQYGCRQSINRHSSTNIRIHLQFHIAKQLKSVSSIPTLTHDAVRSSAKCRRLRRDDNQ